MLSTMPVEYAHYPPALDAQRITLHGGPLDGWEVGVRNPYAPTLRIHGPRHGNHAIWISHTYQLQDGRYIYSASECTSIETRAAGAFRV